jgi:hypothetical protein
MRDYVRPAEGFFFLGGWGGKKVCPIANANAADAALRCTVFVPLKGRAWRGRIGVRNERICQERAHGVGQGSGSGSVPPGSFQ